MQNRRRTLPGIATGILIILGLGLFYFIPRPKQIPKFEGNSLFLFALDELKFAPLSSQGLVFPKDHGAHRRSGIELWQLAGHLETQNGHRFGLETTWLRVDLATGSGQRKSAWATDQVFSMSYTITPYSNAEIYRDRESARKAMGLADYDQTQHKLRVYKRELEFHEFAESPSMELNIPDGTYPVSLEIHPSKPVISPPLSAAFRYYTIPRIAAKGTLTISGVQHAVSGEAFFEHSWGKLPVGRGQLVRNRFILQLSNKIDLYLLQSRRRDGTGKAIDTGFMVPAEGKALPFESRDLNIEASGHWTSRVTGIRYPVQWRINIPEEAIILNLKPWMEEQETTDFLINWAGMASVSGYFGKTPIHGFGQVQLSGY